MAVTFRSVGVSPGANSTDCVIVKPSGLAVDDLMIAHVFTKGAETWSSPAGWTEIRQDGYSGRTNGGLFWKIAVQADVDASDFTFTISFAESNLGAISAWTGHDSSTPINAHNGQASTARTTTVTSPTITPSVADCEILLFVGVYKTSTVSGYAIATDNPGTWNERYDFGGANGVLAMASATRPETSATGDGTATATANEYNVGQLVAIAPAVAIPSAVVGHLIGISVIRKS